MAASEFVCLVLARLPQWLSSRESVCQCRRQELDSWAREDPLEEGKATLSSIFAWGWEMVFSNSAEGVASKSKERKFSSNSVALNSGSKKKKKQTTTMVLPLSEKLCILLK